MQHLIPLSYVRRHVCVMFQFQWRVLFLMNVWIQFLRLKEKQWPEYTNKAEALIQKYQLFDKTKCPTQELQHTLWLCSLNMQNTRHQWAPLSPCKSESQQSLSLVSACQLCSSTDLSDMFLTNWILLWQCFYWLFLHFLSVIFKYMDLQIQETQSVASTFKTSSCSRLIHTILPRAKTHGPLVNMIQINFFFFFDYKK